MKCARWEILYHFQIVLQISCIRHSRLKGGHHVNFFVNFNANCPRVESQVFEVQFSMSQKAVFYFYIFKTDYIPGGKIRLR